MTIYLVEDENGWVTEEYLLRAFLRIIEKEKEYEVFKTALIQDQKPLNS